MSEHGYGHTGPTPSAVPPTRSRPGPRPDQGHAEPTAGATTPPPATPESAATRPTPAAGDPYAPPASQYDARQHAWAPPHTPAPPSYPGYGGHPTPQQTSPASSGVTTAAPRRAGRLRIGLAGLVAGALIGGGAGAGVVTLLDDPATAGGTSAGRAERRHPEPRDGDDRHGGRGEGGAERGDRLRRQQLAARAAAPASSSPRTATC